MPRDQPDPRLPDDRSAVDQPWADGIRKLYDGVAQEPLPRDVQALLDQLGRAHRR